MSDVCEKAGFPPEAHHEIVEGGRPVAGQDHVRLVGQRPQRYPLVAREAVILWKRDHEGLTENGLDRQRAIIHWRPHECDMQTAFVQGRQLIGNTEGVHVKAHVLITPPEPTDQVRKLREVHPRGEPNR
jgi:hypothetical protein